MCAVFYTVKIVCICVFMAYFTSDCLCDKLMDPWNVCLCKCIILFSIFIFDITITIIIIIVISVG